MSGIALIRVVFVRKQTNRGLQIVSVFFLFSYSSCLYRYGVINCKYAKQSFQKPSHLHIARVWASDPFMSVSIWMQQAKQEYQNHGIKLLVLFVLFYIDNPLEPAYDMSASLGRDSAAWDEAQI